MTDKQINQAMADAMGWRKEDGVYVWTANGIDCTCDELWDWANDINAMFLAEQTLSRISLGAMAYWLKEIMPVYAEIFHSTARQRAEAFLRTLDKWEEVQG